MDVIVELAASAPAPASPAFFLLFACVGCHWLLTRHSLPRGLAWLAGTRPKVQEQQPGPAVQLRVHEELRAVLVRSWMRACSYLLHLHLLPMTRTIYEFCLKGDGPSLGWMTSCLIIYAVFWSTATGSVPLSPWRASFGCGLVYSCVLGCVLFSQWQEREDFLARRELLIKAQTILAIVYPHLGFASFFSVCFFSGYAWTTWRVCGSEALTFWFFLHLSYQVVMAVLFAIITETTHRERILAFVNSQDADSLVSAFRQMLKGVCDGDLLLDGGLKICGGSGCLKRLLEMPEDVTGRAFADLIVENKEDIKTFDEFVRNSSQAARNEETAPQCLRVSLKGARRRVNVDVFHVALPKAIGLSSGAHLLALAEDADSRIQFEVASSAALEAEGDAIPESLLSGCHPAKRSAPSVTSMGSALTEQLEMFDELTQLTLLLNVSTELMDVAEVYLRFSRQTDEDQFKLGMPTLKRFVRPLDWLQVEAQLRQFAHAARTSRPKSRNLPPLMFRIPGESKSFLRARDVSVKSMFTGPRPPGQPAWVHLTLSKFNEEKPRIQAETSALEVVHEVSKANS